MADETRDRREETPTPPPAEEQGPNEMETLTKERDDLLARLQRVSADFVNYQKRAQKDVAQAREFANEHLIKALLGVLDDMERALAAARENHPPEDPLLAGMQLVHDQALETLGQFGLNVIEAAGKQFDPQLHSAILQQPSDEHPPLTVLQEVRKGYRLKGRTIRPSSVVVSKEPEAPADGEGQPRTEPSRE